MKKLTLTFATLLLTYIIGFAQTATIQGNVQINNSIDHSGIAVHIDGSTYDGITEVLFDGDITTDANGDYSFSFSLYENDLYPIYGSEYVDAVLTITFSKTGYDSKSLSGISVNETPVTIDNKLLFPTGVTVYTPEICMVRYDTTTNIPNIVWERELGNNIKSYIVYKLINQEWIILDTLEFSELSVFEDMQANPDTAYQYQLQVLFDDNSRSDFSEAKNAPEISIKTENGIPKITWVNINDISRIDPTVIHKVILFRSMSDHNWKPIDSVDVSTATQELLIEKATLQDKSIPEEGIYNYRIGHKLFTACAPKDPLTKTESGPFILAMSNIAESENVPTSIIKTPALSIPKVQISVNENIISISSLVKGTFNVTTIDGKIIAQGNLDIPANFNVNKGIYIINYKVNGVIGSEKILIK